MKPGWVAGSTGAHSRFAGSPWSEASNLMYLVLSHMQLRGCRSRIGGGLWGRANGGAGRSLARGVAWSIRWPWAPCGPRLHLWPAACCPRSLACPGMLSFHIRYPLCAHNDPTLYRGHVPWPPSSRWQSWDLNPNGGSLFSIQGSRGTRAVFKKKDLHP